MLTHIAECAQSAANSGLLCFESSLHQAMETSLGRRRLCQQSANHTAVQHADTSAGTLQAKQDQGARHNQQPQCLLPSTETRVGCKVCAEGQEGGGLQGVGRVKDLSLYACIVQAS